MAILSFISPYFYELPTHHCPFCILQSEYGYIGYLLYGALFGSAVTGMGVGVLMPFRNIASLSEITACLAEKTGPHFPGPGPCLYDSRYLSNDLYRLRSALNQLRPHDRIRINSGRGPGRNDRCNGIGNDGQKKKRGHLGGVDKWNQFKYRIEDGPAFQGRFEENGVGEKYMNVGANDPRRKTLKAR